jgi:hypothetical protein
MILDVDAIPVDKAPGYTYVREEDLSGPQRVAAGVIAE